MDHEASWDLVLSQAKFAFNKYVNRYNGCTPFEVVYGFWPLTLINLHTLSLLARLSEAALDFLRYMKDVHEEVKRCLSHSTEAYAIGANVWWKDRKFDIGEKVLIRLRPERFPPGSFIKLHAQGARPFKAAKKLGPNAYVIDLPLDYNISLVFNIKDDLTQYHGLEEQLVTTIDLPSK